MRVYIFLLLMQCSIYYIHQNHTFGTPMFGENVRDALPGEFPYVASIMWNKVPYPDFEGVHICTGSLVTRVDVLTAAHCFDNATFDMIEVILGSIDLGNGTRYRTSWWITYNEWANFNKIKLSHRTNDIATLRLCDPVPQNQAIGILSDLPISLFYDANVTIAAWGRNTENIVPERMRTVNLKVLTKKCCREKFEEYGEKIKLHDRYICTTADPYAIMHHGDSGGPIIFVDMIIAIHKSTMPFPGDMLNPRKINVHTTISYYKLFITHVIHPDFNWLQKPQSNPNDDKYKKYKYKDDKDNL